MGMTDKNLKNKPKASFILDAEVQKRPVYPQRKMQGLKLELNISGDVKSK